MLAPSHSTVHQRPHQDLVRFLHWLTDGWEDGCLELRLLPTTQNGQPLVGFFTDPDAAARAVVRWDRKLQCYVGLNPRHRSMLSLAENRFTRAARAGRANDVLAVTAILIDIDPVRPDGVPSNSEELQAAKDTAKAVIQHLKEQGCGDPLVALSGNGIHLLWRIHPQNPNEFSPRVKTFLKDISSKFSNDKVNIDEKVWDPARISKLIGTLSIKGTSTPDRPWRRARILRWADPVPDEGVVRVVLSRAPAASRPRQATAPVFARNVSEEGVRAVVRALLPYWDPGRRHRLALGVAGLLAQEGWPEEAVATVVEELCTRAGDPEPDDRLRAVEDTYARFMAGQPVAGASILLECLPREAVDSLSWAAEQHRPQVQELAPAEALRAETLADVPKPTATLLKERPHNRWLQQERIYEAARALRECGFSPAGTVYAISRSPLGHGLNPKDIEEMVLLALEEGETA